MVFEYILKKQGIDRLRTLILFRTLISVNLTGICLRTGDYTMEFEPATALELEG